MVGDVQKFLRPHLRSFFYCLDVIEDIAYMVFLSALLRFLRDFWISTHNGYLTALLALFGAIVYTIIISLNNC